MLSTRLKEVERAALHPLHAGARQVETDQSMALT